jgi:hypothetical protein
MGRSQARWYLRRGIDTVRYEGLHILMWRVLRLGLSPLGRLAIVSFCRKDLTQPLRRTQAKVGLIVSQATEADIDKLAALVGKRYGPSSMRRWFKARSIQETIRDRFEEGARCFVGKIGTEIVHYNWIFFRRKDWPGVPYFIQLSEREALCDEAFTVEELRGKGIHGAVHNQMLLFLQQSGFRTAYTLVHTDDISARKALHRLGWDFYATLLHFSPRKSDRVFWWQIRGSFLAPFVIIRMRKSEQLGKTQRQPTQK